MTVLSNGIINILKVAPRRTEVLRMNRTLYVKYE